ncbi:MAG: hypothetical protein AABY07_04405, partial [Nanoarchaeota archaeon]
KREDKKDNTLLIHPCSLGKKVKTTALVGQELIAKAKVCDKTVVLDDFKKQDKKALKKLAEETDYFIAQANIMPQVAATFGKILGPRGKMPNPKAGCVVPPIIPDLKPTVEKLQKTIKLETKNEPTLKLRIGSESSKDEEIAENILSVYNNILTALPQEKNNIKNMVLKLTMGKPFIIQSKEKEKKQAKK